MKCVFAEILSEKWIIAHCLVEFGEHLSLRIDLLLVVYLCQFTMRFFFVYIFYFNLLWLIVVVNRPGFEPNAKVYSLSHLVHEVLLRIKGTTVLLLTSLLTFLSIWRMGWCLVRDL